MGRDDRAGPDMVRNGYDEIAEKYPAYRSLFDNNRELEEFTALLPARGRVLDVGCGTGVPVLEFLAERGFRGVGTDFSDRMLELAHGNVRQAKFARMDMTEIGFTENSFDGITAFYSIIHVPREKHAFLFRAFRRILRPDGAMLVSMGSSEWEGTEDFFDVKMFWSHYGPQKSLEFVKQAGFEIVFARFVEMADEKHYWILARNRKSAEAYAKRHSE